MTDSSTITYLCLKTDTAQKLGRNGGGITYKVLSDVEHHQLFITLVGNDGGGYYSREIVAFDVVEACLPDDQTQSLAAKAFAPSFVGKSSNNPGFMAAILRSEGLLGGVDGKPNLHQITGDWAAWKAALLAQPGEPYVPPTKEPLAVEGAGEQSRPDVPGDDGVEERPGRRKSEKGRAVKPDEGADHADSA